MDQNSKGGITTASFDVLLAKAKDDSLQIEFLGTGITICIGRKMGISVLGSSFGVDFGRCTIA